MSLEKPMSFAGRVQRLLGHLAAAGLRLVRLIARMTVLNQ